MSIYEGKLAGYYFKGGTAPTEGQFWVYDATNKVFRPASLTSIVGGTWKVLYTDGSGVLTELALATSGKVLTANGTTSAPTFETPSLISKGGGSITMQTNGSALIRFPNAADDVIYVDALVTIANGSSITGTQRPYNFDVAVTATDLAAATSVSSGLRGGFEFGVGGVASVGTLSAGTFDGVVSGNGHADNEHCLIGGVLRYDIGTGYTQAAGPSGRAWVRDLTLLGPIAVQPDMLSGINMFINNYYNGSPIDGDAIAISIATKAGSGGGSDALHSAAATYPVDVGLAVTGIASSSAKGFTTGIRVGGTSPSWATTSRIGTGVQILDFDTYGINISGVYTGTTPYAIVVANSAWYVGLGTVTPKVTLDVYRSDAGTGALVSIENNGTGDATLRWLLTSSRAWCGGIDNSDSDSWKLSSADDAFASATFIATTGGQIKLPTTGSGAGILMGGDAQIYRGAANRIDLAAGDSLAFNGATSGVVTMSVAAAAGTWTFTLPPDDGDVGEQLQTDGAGNTTWEAAASRREVKLLSGLLSKTDALDRILSANIYRFKYRPEWRSVGGDYETEFVGVVADEAPWVMMHRERIFSPISAFGYTAAAIQQLDARIKILEGGS